MKTKVVILFVMLSLLIISCKGEKEKICDANSEANSAIKVAYVTCQAYFINYPEVKINIQDQISAIEKAQDFDISSNGKKLVQRKRGVLKPYINISIIGNQSNLRILTSHVNGDIVYSADAKGTITPFPKITGELAPFIKKEETVGVPVQNKQPLAIEKLLGLSREDVRSQLGKPDHTVGGDLGKSFAKLAAKLGLPDRGDSSDNFNEVAITVRYKDLNTIMVTATVLMSGDTFSGKVLGIGLGDSKKACVAAWGASVRTEETPVDYEEVTWHHKGYVLELEMWTEGGSAPLFGNYKKDTVKQISIFKNLE